MISLARGMNPSLTSGAPGVLATTCVALGLGLAIPGTALAVPGAARTTPAAAAVKAPTAAAKKAPAAASVESARSGVPRREPDHRIQCER